MQKFLDVMDAQGQDVTVKVTGHDVTDVADEVLGQDVTDRSGQDVTVGIGSRDVDAVGYGSGRDEE